jgi:hypothetical protein
VASGRDFYFVLFRGYFHLSLFCVKQFFLFYTFKSKIFSGNICEEVEVNLAVAVLLPGVTRQFACGRLSHANCVAMHLTLPDLSKI